MRIFSKKENYGYLLIKKTLPILFKNYFALFFMLSTIIFNTALLIGALYIEYTYLGVHVLDFNSLNALIHANFWDHALHFLSIFFILTFAFIITTSLKFSLAYVLIEKLQNKKVSFIKALKIPLTRLKEVVRFGFIRVFGYPKYWFYVIDPITQSTRIKSFLENSLEDEYDKYSHPKGMLFLPLLVEQPLNVVEALKLSEELLQNKFGKPIEYNFSYQEIRILVSCVLLISSFILFHFIIGFEVFPTICIGLYFITLIFHVLANIKLVFDTIIYNYCNNISSEIFSQEEINKMLL